MKLDFSTGIPPTLEEVLDQRERRVFRINQLLTKSDETVICFKLNIPGPIKNNETIMYLFREALKLLKEKIQYIEQFYEDNICGPELIATTTLSPIETKKSAIQFEETNFLTRLCDVDVYGSDGVVSRTDLGVKPRRCFMCDNEAKACARSRTHSVQELLDFISSQLS